jgi:flagellar capping protein FliD
LADLGVELSNSGQASFNSNTFDTLTDNRVADGFKFIGSASTGLGGFSRQLSAYSDPISGIIKTEEDGLDRTDKSLQNQITTLTDRIAIAHQSLIARLQQADALVAMMQAQQTQLSASLQGLNVVLYGKNANQTT